MLISLEQEMPTVCLKGGTAVLPEVFTGIWQELTCDGWSNEGGFGVSRALPSSAMKPAELISTDTGPTIEIAPCPAETIPVLEARTTKLRALIGRKLQEHSIGLLGSGTHLRLGNSEAEYYRYRTQRTAYDYAIRIRGWQHRTLLNVAALQEVVDVPISQAPLALSVMHRLAGIFLFLFRNDPELKREDTALLSIRPAAWRDQVPTGGTFGSDLSKVFLPKEEVHTWGSYLHLLWNSSKMFLVGSKAGGLVYVPDHPTFWTFVSQPPKDGWRVMRLDGTDAGTIVPEFSHVAQSDWTYMGFARLRLFWKNGADLQELIVAYRAGERELQAFLQDNLVKVLIENRSSASPAPGCEMGSVALVTGLIENLSAVAARLDRHPYEFWVDLARQAEWLPLQKSARSDEIAEVVLTVLGLAQDGLKRRGYGEEGYLAPLMEQTRRRTSPSELMLDTYRRGGEHAVLEQLLYRFSS